MAARNQNTDCQPASTYSCAPIIGAIAGATPKKIVTCDITRCASAGGYMSRITARDTTMPAPVARPCTARHTISWPIVCDSAQPTEPSVNSATPHRMTGRRPKLSASAPWNRFISAKPAR